MKTQFCILCQEKTLYEAWRYVKTKGAAGGIDGVTIAAFNKDKVHQINLLREELLNGKWKPQPYLQISIPKTKDPKETRTLGMAVVRDKIVQQAIRSIIEPRFERLFLPNSFAYRPGKGALNTIKYIVRQCGNADFKYALRLDVDNFFDGIDHAILQQRLTAIGVESELVRLIMLSVKMGRVKVSGVWTEPDKGIPQGAVLSPLLANLYLHSFDQFVASRGLPYARYGDDSFILCKTLEQAEEIREKAQKYITTKLKLSLNTPAVSAISDGFDFLGVTIQGQRVFITEQKKEELEKRIRGLYVNPDGIVGKSVCLLIFSRLGFFAIKAVCVFFSQMYFSGEIFGGFAKNHYFCTRKKRLKPYPFFARVGFLEIGKNICEKFWSCILLITKAFCEALIPKPHDLRIK